MVILYFLGFVSLVPAVCAELWGIEHVATVMGLLRTSMTFGSLLATPLAGWLYLIQGNYTVPICVAGSFMILGCLIIDMMSDKESIVRISAHSLAFHHDYSQEEYLVTVHNDENPLPRHRNVSFSGTITRRRTYSSWNPPQYIGSNKSDIESNKTIKSSKLSEVSTAVDNRPFSIVALEMESVRDVETI